MTGYEVADRLIELLVKEMPTWLLPRAETQLSELEVTGKVLVPIFEKFVRGLRHRSLIVNGDGHTVPSALVQARMSFVPDIEIIEFGQRLLAVEVKIIRDLDPSGAVTKALGQSLMYKSMGFRHAHAILIDCRDEAVVAWKSKLTSQFAMPNGLGMTVFAADSNQDFQIVHQSANHSVDA